MVEVHRTVDEAAAETVARLCGVIDTYVAIQREMLAMFPEGGSTAAVALGAQLDQLEATARDGSKPIS